LRTAYLLISEYFIWSFLSFCTNVVFCLSRFSC